jgi:restriction endonuclease
MSETSCSQERPRTKWETFEAAVASVQALLSPNANVTRNVKLVDRLGHERQFDVVIRGQWAGRHVLGVIECKDWSVKVDLPEVEAFVTKKENVRANLAIMVSRCGFTQKAIDLAKHHAIGTLSLLPDDDAHGFAIGFQSFAFFFKWTQLILRVRLAGKTRIPRSLKVESVQYKGHKLIDWFRGRLDCEHRTTELAGITSTSSSIAQR